MAVTFQKELFAKVMPELPEIFLKHAGEVDEDKSSPVDPDWQRYCMMELQGLLHVITARDDGYLIGYYIAVVVTHLHYKTKKCAWCDMFYIRPEYRWGWTGMKLFLEAEKALKALGVRKSYLVTKIKLPITIILKRLGYILVEQTHTKMF